MIFKETVTCKRLWKKPKAPAEWNETVFILCVEDACTPFRHLLSLTLYNGVHTVTSIHVNPWEYAGSLSVTTLFYLSSVCSNIGQIFTFPKIPTECDHSIHQETNASSLRQYKHGVRVQRGSERPPWGQSFSTGMGFLGDIHYGLKNRYPIVDP